MKKVFLMIAAAATLLGACQSNSLKQQVSGKLSSQGTQVADLKMFVGSALGGQPVTLTKEMADKYWEHEIENESCWDSISIEFLSENELKQSEHDTIEYKFVKDSVFCYSKEDDRWEYFGVGSSDEIKKTLGLLKYCDSTSSGTSKSDEYYTLETALKHAGFDSLSDMKHVEDTVAWMNMYHLYK